MVIPATRYNMISVTEKLQKGVERVNHDLSQMGLLLSPKKCKTMTFVKKKQSHQDPIGISLDSCTLEKTDVVKYLGLQPD